MYSHIFNEIGTALEEDASVNLFDCCIYKRSRNKFQVYKDVIPSYWEPVSPEFRTFLEAVDWIINDRK